MYAADFVERVHAARAGLLAPRKQTAAADALKLAREARRLFCEARTDREAAARLLADARCHAAAILAEARVKVELDGPRPPMAADLIAAVAERHGVAVAAIVGEGRGREVVAARRAAIVLVAGARPDLSLSALARIFRRDRNSIRYALRQAGRVG